MDSDNSFLTNIIDTPRNKDLGVASIILFLLALICPITFFISKSFQFDFLNNIIKHFPLNIIFMTPFALSSSFVGIGVGLAGLVIKAQVKRPALIGLIINLCLFVTLYVSARSMYGEFPFP